MSFFDTQNPGIGGLDELTTGEELVVQQIAALADPNADRILFWDDSAGSYAYLTVGTGLSITTTTLTSTYAPGGTDVPIADGGTGLSSISAKSIWAANSADTLVELTPGAGQSVRINAGNTAWEVFTPASGTGVTWNEETGVSVSAAINNAYILNNAALVTLTLPDTAAVGAVLRVVGKGAGGGLIAQNASENINFGNVTTTTGVGGSLASTHRYDCIELVCTVANTTWTVMSAQGNITIV